mgnify:CR=1 FL=1
MLFDSLLPPAPGTDPRAAERALQLTTAVMLVEVMRADASFHAGEREAVQAALGDKFAPTGDEAQALAELAETTVHQATDPFTFTSRINEHFELAQKRRMLEHMWHLADADGHLSEHERHVLWRIADLLHVSQGAYVNARMRAQRASEAERGAARRGWREPPCRGRLRQLEVAQRGRRQIDQVAGVRHLERAHMRQRRPLGVLGVGQQRGGGGGVSGCVAFRVRYCCIMGVWAERSPWSNSALSMEAVMSADMVGRDRERVGGSATACTRASRTAVLPTSPNFQPSGSSWLMWRGAAKPSPMPTCAHPSSCACAASRLRRACRDHGRQAGGRRQTVARASCTLR